MTPKAWYPKTSGHQGIISEESTGRSVAVSYDPKDAPLIAAAPKLLAALLGLKNRDSNCYDRCHEHGLQRHSPACESARAAIADAENAS